MYCASQQLHRISVDLFKYNFRVDRESGRIQMLMILPKGFDEPVTVYEVSGIGDPFNIHLE